MARYRLSVRQHNSATRPNSKWVLDIRYPNGKRERRYFATKEEAVAEQSVKQVEVENLGLRALEISGRLRLEALDAQEKLAGYGVTLTQVVDDYIRRRGSPKTTVREVADIYLKSRIKHGRSKKHLDSLRRLFERFCVSHGTDRVNDITGNQVEGWLHDLGVGPVTINTYRSLLHSLFEFGVRKKLCPENPVKAVERMTVKAEEVGILTPDQLAKLLEVSQGDVRATVALGAFAGIRPEEIVRLTWEEVSLEKGHITIALTHSEESVAYMAGLGLGQFLFSINPSLSLSLLAVTKLHAEELGKFNLSQRGVPWNQKQDEQVFIASQLGRSPTLAESTVSLDESKLLTDDFSRYPSVLALTPLMAAFGEQATDPLAQRFFGRIAELLVTSWLSESNHRSRPFDDEERDHFNYKIRFRFLDDEYRLACGFPIRDATVPLSQVNELTFKGCRCLIVENLMIFLTLPSLPRTIAIFGAGKAAALLPSIPWLRENKVSYWGDMDDVGFRILSGLRHAGLVVESIFMDDKTWIKFSELAHPGNVEAGSQDLHLKGSELSAWKKVREKRLMLEQELLPQNYIERELAALFVPPRVQ